MKVNIVNKSAYPTPAYATEKSAGMDLKANLTEPVILGPLERAMIPTGLFIALPDGTEAQVRPRSGLAAKHGISGLNSPGTIDADYRGEIGVILVNLSNDDFVINPGEVYDPYDDHFPEGYEHIKENAAIGVETFIDRIIYLT